MSQALMKEGDSESLDEIRPTIQALCVFLTRENNGLPIIERKQMNDARGRSLHVMSNGFTYTRAENGRWQVYSE